MDPIRDDNLNDYLTALADGELDAETALTMWKYLADHPQVLQWLRDQQRLTLAARRSSIGTTPPTLRVSIEELLRSNPPATDEQPYPIQAVTGRPHAFGKWSAVAGLLVGIVGTWISLRPATTPPVLPVTMVVHASRIHGDCSRLADGLHAASFESTAADLAASVRADLQTKDPYPDLSSLGFRYVGAGPCGAPLEGTIHLLYRTTQPGLNSSVSIFVQSNRGQFEMGGSQVYTVSSPSSPFPMTAWQTNLVVYFLLADDEPTQNAVKELLLQGKSRQTLPAQSK